MWRDYFGPRATIIGVDIAPATRVYEKNPQYGSPDRIVIGNQGDPVFWSRFRDEVPVVDAILDDGGHLVEQQNATLSEMFPHLSNGGVFLCEDTTGDYAREGGSFGDNGFARIVYERFLASGSGLMGWSPGKCSRTERYPGRHNRKGCLHPARSMRQRYVAEVSFYPYMVVLEKYAKPSKGMRQDQHGNQWQPKNKVQFR